MTDEDVPGVKDDGAVPYGWANTAAHPLDDLAAAAVFGPRLPCWEPVECTDAYALALAGRPISECPYDLQSIEGRAWCQFWIAGEERRRMEAGTFGAAKEDVDAARAMTVADWGHDPVVEILGGYDPPKPREPTQLERIENEMAMAELAARMRECGGVAGLIQQVTKAAAESFDALWSQWQADIARYLVVPDPPKPNRAQQRRRPASKKRGGKPRRPFLCHRHGLQQTVGFCRTCQRGRG